jgi:hypothetical protein
LRGTAFVTKLNSAGSALAYSTYLGGSGVEYGSAIAVDSAGSAYVTGFTASRDFPTANAYQSALGGQTDAFVTRLSATGNTLLFSTYLGQSEDDGGDDLTLDAQGNVYIVGSTRSPRFPLADPHQSALAGDFDAFVSTLDAGGKTLLFSSFAGGSAADGASAVSLDGSGSIYVGGFTNSTNFPTLRPAQARGGGNGDAFVLKLGAVSTSRPSPAPVPVIPQALRGASRTFHETGKSVSGLFLDYWYSHGGLVQQGYPISDLLQGVSDEDGKTYIMQYFERAVFEYHPELAAPNNVLLSMLGSFEYKRKYPAAGGAPNQRPNRANGKFFPETGRWVGGKFWEYWQAHGGLAQQGLPISDEFTEKSALDGKEYVVQYFERAVFELHPEYAGSPYEVLLSQLGTYRYDDQYGGR